MPIVTTFHEECPTATSLMGDEISHPEAVSTSCDRCGKSGHVFEGACISADEHDVDLICEDCDSDAVQITAKAVVEDERDLPDKVGSSLQELLYRKLSEDYGADVDYATVAIEEHRGDET